MAASEDEFIWKYSYMAASQRHMKTYIHFINSYTFYISYFDVMLKKNEFL